MQLLCLVMGWSMHENAWRTVYKRGADNFYELSAPLLYTIAMEVEE